MRARKRSITGCMYGAVTSTFPGIDGVNLSPARSALRQLACEVPHEVRVVDRVATPQPSEVLAREPIQPLEPGALHEPRRHLDAASEEVEGGAHRDHHAAADL